MQGYDLRTLVSVCAAIFAGLTLALVVVWRQSRGTAGLSTLSLAHGVTAVAAVLVAVSGGRGPVTAIVANTLLVAAPALLHQGTRRFFDLPARPVRTAGVTLGALAGFTWATLVEPSTFARTLLFSGAGSALFAAATWVTAFHGRRREPSPTVALMAACLGILAGFMGLRFVFALFGTGFAGLWAAAVLVVTPMAGVGWIVGLVTTLNQRLLVSLRQSRDLFESLLSVSQAVSGGPGVRDTLRGALEVANRLTGAQGASLHLIDEKGQVARGLHTRGAVDSPPHTPRSVRLIREGLAGWVARERATALVRDTDDDPRWVPLSASDQPARSALAVPISSDEVLVGVLTLVHSEPHHFDDGHRLLMEAAAAQMALALRNAQIADARLTLAQRQTLLYEVLRAASQRHDTALIAAAAARAITEGTRYTRVDVVLPGTDGHWDIYSSDAPPGEAPFRPTLVEGIVGRAFATRATQVVPDVTRDPDYRERSPGVRSEMCVPLAAGERLLGVLNVESNVPTTFSDEDVRAVESLGEAIVLGLENARLYAQVSAQRARLEAVIESSRDGLVLVGTDGRLLLVSEPALRQLGLQGSSQDWFGWPGEALDAMLRAHGTGAALPAGYVEGNAGGPESGEWRIDTRTLVWLNLPVPDVGRLLVVRDVTQEREAERLRDTLTHTLVHDLRNPLAAIFGALELLREAVTSSPQHVELLRLAQDNAERQLRLISAILDVSRLEQGALPLERGALALRGVVANALRLVAPAARAQSLELADNVPEGLPDAWADGDLVARVLDNLLNNAIRFTPHGGRVTVGADVVPGGAPGGRVLRVRVSDTGRGVAEDVRPRLFQKFSTGRGRGSGSGLGLAFCRLVVEAHGGTIWLEDGAGPGTTIVFTLPAAGAARHALAGPEPACA